MLVGAKTGREQGTSPAVEMASRRTVQGHLLPLKGHGIERLLLVEPRPDGLDDLCGSPG